MEGVSGWWYTLALQIQIIYLSPFILIHLIHQLATINQYGLHATREKQPSSSSHSRTTPTPRPPLVPNPASPSHQHRNILSPSNLHPVPSATEDTAAEASFSNASRMTRGRCSGWKMYVVESNEGNVKGNASVSSALFCSRSAESRPTAMTSFYWY